MDYLESLAKIRLEKEEKTKLISEIEETVEYFNALGALDTEGVLPMSHCLDIKCRMRADEIGPSLNQKDALKNAENAEGGFFTAPETFSQEGSDET